MTMATMTFQMLWTFATMILANNRKNSGVLFLPRFLGEG